METSDNETTNNANAAQPSNRNNNPDDEFNFDAYDEEG